MKLLKIKCPYVLANQRAGKKWSLEDDEEEEEEDAKLKAEALKSDPLETIQEEMQVDEPQAEEADDVDPLDAFMKVCICLPKFDIAQMSYLFFLLFL